MKKIIIIIGLLLCSNIAFSAPSITSDSGSFVHGQSSSLYGADFGVKTPAAPLVWDRFEWGVEGDDLSGGGWTVNVAGAQDITYADKYSGTRSAHWQYLAGTPQEFHHAYKDIGLQDEVYFSYKFRYNGPGGGVGKFPRITANNKYSGLPGLLVSSGDVGGGTILRIYYDYNDGNDYCGVESLSCDSLDKRGNYSYNQWYGMEMYNRLSQPGGASNGEASVFVDGVGMGTDFGGTGVTTNAITRATGNTDQLQYMLIGWTTTAPNATSNFYCDDVYVDNTKSRVVLCNASTLTASTQREIQPQTRHDSDGEQIDITFNKGAFSSGNTPYIIVVDADGGESPGYQITISDSNNPTVTLQANKQAPSPTTYGGTATATTGRTITGVVSSNGFTVTPDDGTWDEQEEAFTVSGVTVPAEGVTDTCTATDDQGDTGNTPITITLPTDPTVTITPISPTTNATATITGTITAVTETTITGATCTGGHTATVGSPTGLVYPFSVTVPLSVGDNSFTITGNCSNGTTGSGSVTITRNPVAPTSSAGMSGTNFSGGFFK